MKRPDTFRELAPVTGTDPIPTVSCAEALRTKERPVVLFTPALLFTRCGFDRDPMVEFDAYCPAPSRELRPFCVDLKHDKQFFFHGFGVMPPPGKQQPVNWDKRLYAIDQSREEECFGFLNGIAYSDPKTNFFASTFSYSMQIPDPTSYAKELLSVRVFGVISNTFVAFLETNRYSPDEQPTVNIVFTPEPRRLLQTMSGGQIMTEFTGEDPLQMRE